MSDALTQPSAEFGGRFLRRESQGEFLRSARFVYLDLQAAYSPDAGKVRSLSPPGNSVNKRPTSKRRIETLKRKDPGPDAFQRPNKYDSWGWLKDARCTAARVNGLESWV